MRPTPRIEALKASRARKVLSPQRPGQWSLLEGPTLISEECLGREPPRLLTQRPGPWRPPAARTFLAPPADQEKWSPPDESRTPQLSRQKAPACTAPPARVALGRRSSGRGARGRVPGLQRYAPGDA